MIQPLHQEYAQIRHAEMRQDAAIRRLTRQPDRDGAPVTTRRQRRDILSLQKLASSIAMVPARLAAAAGRH